MLKVELVYVDGEGSVTQLQLDLKEGTTLAEALDQSGIYRTHPETQTLPVGVFSKKLPLDTVMKSGDRIEIYRPLALDPKEKRRKKARSRP